MIDATTPRKIDALDSAYHFAIELLRSELTISDGNEIASVAAAYALAHWSDWMDGPDEQQELARVRESLALADTESASLA